MDGPAPRMVPVSPSNAIPGLSSISIRSHSKSVMDISHDMDALTGIIAEHLL
jgi:hypothetical protein